MVVINNLLEDIEKYPLSIELLNQCTNFCQYGNTLVGEDKELFIQLLEKKISEYFKENTRNIALSLTDYILGGGVITINDVIFIGDAIVVEFTNHIMNIDDVDYIGSQTGGYRLCYSSDFVDTFSKKDESLGIEFSKSFNTIYEKSYGYRPLPSILDWEQQWQEAHFAINQDPQDIANAYESGYETTFQIVDQNKQDQLLHLIEVKISKQKGQTTLQVVNDTKSIQKLSEIIEEKKKSSSAIQKKYSVNS